jgi:hypothetical protein
MAKILLNSFPKSGTNLMEEFLKINGIIHNRKSISPTRYLFRDGFRRFHRLDPNFILSSILKKNIDIGFEQAADYPCHVLLERLPKQENTYTSSHIAYSEAAYDIILSENVRLLYVHRDPSKVLLSYVHYARSNPKHVLYRYIKNKALKDIITIMIEGRDVGPYKLRPWRDVVRLSNGWLQTQNSKIKTVSYEQMISADTSELESELSNFLEIDCMTSFSKVIGLGKTFRKKNADSIRDDEALLKFIENCDV